MRTERRLLKHRKGVARPVGTLASPSPSGLDKWLSRLASASQPLLLLLATFGYFYTVVPIYQKEMLSEQIAAKEIELSRLQKQIDLSGPVITGLKDQVAYLNAQTHVLELERLRTETAIAELKALRVELNTKNDTLAKRISTWPRNPSPQRLKLPKRRDECITTAFQGQ